MQIIKAETKDLPEILQLQYAAYQSEARLLNNFNIPPLRQTLAEVQQEHSKGFILKTLDEQGRIIGSVRGCRDQNTVYIGKLMVLPSCQGKGLGKQLLEAAEKVYPHCRCELFTSSQSVRNIQFYESVGYRVFKEKNISAKLSFVYLEKPAD